MDEEDHVVLEEFSQQSVDRFGIILDLWISEAQYMQAKMKVS